MMPSTACVCKSAMACATLLAVQTL